MASSYVLQHVHAKRILFFLLLILVPNYLIMQFELVGPIDDRIGVATALDLTLILPLLLYFFGFKKKMSWLFLCGFILIGVVLANLIIPSHADGYLSYFNHSVIVLEAALISFELILFILIARRFPLLVKNYKANKSEHYHFLSSFSVATRQTFSFKSKHLQKAQLPFRILATDLAAFYYVLFTWRKKPVQGFFFHKDGSYLGVFFMLIHAMLIEIIAVHLMIAQYSHTAARIITALDVYALLFIVSDYQAIRLSPVVLDKTGLHFQKGIREYGTVPWDKIEGLYPNDELAGKNSVELAFHGLEKEPSPYVIRLKEPVEIHKVFGLKKTIHSVFVKMDDPEEFRKAFDGYNAG
ncbi:hypothetical protein EQV77_06265 [Halobacillus fulvus]|nr:hypothetical protein EQV77_06265 [Halobacillus fulvus]